MLRAALGICVNTVIPGFLHMPMVEIGLARRRTGLDVDDLLAQRLRLMSLGLMCDERDTANAVLFLASDDARFFTGTEIVVNGSMTARRD